MANKKLGSATPSVDTETTLYTVPTGKSAVFNINVCNTSITDVVVKIKIGGDYIENGVVISANGVLERTGLIAEADEVLAIESNTANVVFRAYGIEE